jgi:flagellar basal-body rod protein FlgB
MSFIQPNDKVLGNLMSASTLRYKVLANNLTNQNTPGYKRSTVKFEDLLASELSQESPDILSVRPQVVEDNITPSAADGNNVSPELELNGMMQNRLQFELYSTLLGGRMELLRTAIQGGR